MKKQNEIKTGLKTIFSYLLEYRRDIIILSILGVISAIANGSVPYLIGRFFDAILVPSQVFLNTFLEMPLWLFLIIIWGITQIIANVIDWQVNTKSNWIGGALYSDYLIRGLGRLLELPMSFHSKHKMGTIMDKLSSAANSLITIVSEIINLTPQFLSIIVAFIITFFINATLATILSLGVIVYIIILYKVTAPLALLQKRMYTAYDQAYGDSYDAIFNTQTIKQVVSEKMEQRKMFQKFKLRAFFLYKQMITVWEKLSFYQRSIVVIVQFLVFILSIFFINKGEMTIGELIMFNGYTAMLFGPFAILGRKWQTIQNGIITINRNEKILSLPTEKYIPKNQIILNDIKGNIAFKNVYFSYEQKQKNTLEDLSLEVKQGETIAIVGESGEGKSTLVDLISGYYFAKKGKVMIDGHNIKNLGLQFLRSKIAVVPQEVTLFNESIKYNIQYGNFNASDTQIEMASHKAHCLDFIKKFPKKWKQVVGERGVKLSVGQKQRVAIARAILKDPRILILDEPTSALDARSEKIIQESLEELMKNKTTFIIAHRLSTTRKADKILVLSKGKIAEQGKHSELMQIPNGIYRHLYELQIGLK